jgi:hypothetical protein
MVYCENKDGRSLLFCKEGDGEGFSESKKIGMSEYLIRLKYHLVPATKPDGWENPMHYDVHLMNVRNFEDIQKMTNETISSILRTGSAIVMKSSAKPTENENVELLNSRVFVPLHMVSFIETEIKAVTGQTPWVPNGFSEGVLLQ